MTILKMNETNYIINDKYLMIDGHKFKGRGVKFIKKWCPDVYLKATNIKKQIKEQDYINNLFKNIDEYLNKMNNDTIKQ